MIKETNSFIEKEANAVSVSLLKSLDEKLEIDYLTPDFCPENIIDYYNECLEKVDPNGEQSMKDAIKMYCGED